MEEKIQRDARNYVGKQTVVHVQRRFGNRQTKLFETAAHVARLHLLIANHRVRDDDQFLCARHRNRRRMCRDERFQLVYALICRKRQNEFDFFFLILRICRRRRR